MSSEPLVTIVIPSYNHERYVVDSIKGVVSQTYNNVELIIIDDGSTDGSVSRIESMLDTCRERFKRFEFRSRPNKGLCATLNEALEWSQGEFFSLIASDDILLENKTSVLVDVLKTDDSIVAAFGGLELIDDLNRPVASVYGADKVHTFDEIIMGETVPGAPAGLMRTPALKRVGGYPESLSVEDWYMWLTLTNTGQRLRSIKEPVVKYRLHENNTAKKYKLMHEQRLKILSFFTQSHLYSRAVNRAYLTSAAEASSVPDVPFTLAMIRSAKGESYRLRCLYLLKSLLPKSIVKVAKIFLKK